MVSAWCSDDQQGALTKLKSGGNLPSKTCDNPVREQYELGQLIGVRGTPTILFNDGQLIVGSLPADDLAELLLSE
jgi:thiol:disulfide interchange protein DsbC